MKRLLDIATQRHIAFAALKVSLVVGTVLNIINQGGRVVDGLPLSWLHVGMNYLVPYCVASYSAAKNEQAIKGWVSVSSSEKSITSK